jgi:hypothetical protein
MDMNDMSTITVVNLRVLGPLEVYRDGTRPGIVRRRERALLGLLLLAAGTTVRGRSAGLDAVGR